MAVAADNVLDRKLDRVFGMLDFNRDGILGPEDLDTVAHQLGAAFGLRDDDPKVIRLRQAFGRLWPDVSRTAADGDGLITNDEYRASMRASAVEDRDGFLDRFATMTAAWLDIADTDADGLVSRDEYTAMFVATVDAAPEALETAFAQLDRNGDGFLNTEEIRIAVEEFYTSEDPESRGNWLLGPF